MMMGNGVGLLSVMYAHASVNLCLLENFEAPCETSNANITTIRSFHQQIHKELASDLPFLRVSAAGGIVLSFNVTSTSESGARSDLSVFSICKHLSLAMKQSCDILESVRHGDM